MLVGFLASLLLVVATASGQIRIRGQVTDAETGASLPHATIQIPGTTRGTVANTNGQFSITITRYPTVLEFRYIGYISQRVEITSDNAASLLIRLTPSAVSLDEVVITDDNPAEGIIRQVIAARNRMRANLLSVYADTYTRFMLYADFDLVQMNESVRASWWTPESGSRELIRADRSQPARSGVFRFAKPHHVANFYDDSVEILGTRYASPLHPQSTDFYVFTLAGTRDLDGETVYDIYFTPKSATRPTFSGHMAVLDSVYAVLQISARPSPGTVVTPPVESHDLYMEQRYVELGDSLWLPLDLYVTGTVTFGRAGVSYPSARYEQVSGMSLHVVNPPVPDSLGVPGPSQVRHPLADINVDLFLQNPSYIPMTPREAEQMFTMPPGMTLESAFRPEGLLSNYTAVAVSEEDPDEERAAGRLALVDRIAAGDWFWFNRVDGWHPGLGYGIERDHAISWRTSVGYSRQRKRPSYKAEVSVPWQTRFVRGYVNASILDATSVVARPEALGRFVPGMATYMGWDDIYDYFDLQKQTAGVDFVPIGFPVLLSVSFSREKHRSLKRLSDFDGWLFQNDQRENPPVKRGILRSVIVGAEFGDRERLSLDLAFERSPGPIWDSDFEFRRFEARGSLKLETFYKSRSRPNWFRITAIGGTSQGALPLQRQFSLSGSAGPFAEFAGFRTLSSSRFLADELAGIFWTHDFTTALFEKLGLWWLADKGMGIHFFGGHAFSSKVDLGEFGGRHHEIGAGISYPFGLPFRVDVATGSEGGTFFRLGRPLR